MNILRDLARVKSALSDAESVVQEAIDRIEELEKEKSALEDKIGDLEREIDDAMNVARSLEELE